MLLICRYFHTVNYFEEILLPINDPNKAPKGPPNENPINPPNK